MVRPPVLLLLAVGLPLWPCSRPQVSMGREIQSAELIAIVDITPASSFDRVTINFREYLKGNSAQQTVSIRGRDCPYVPDGRGYALLLSKGWQSNEWPVVEVYTASADIADLRTLVKLYALPSERQRLDALKRLALSGSRRYREQLFDDLRNMREPASYPLLTDLYPTMDKAGRSELIDLIGCIGDPRGVPVLLEALQSPDANIADAAHRALASWFPEAPGVAEGLRRHSSVESPENEMQKAFRLFREGRKTEAVPLLRIVATDERESVEIRMWAALDIIGQLDAHDKNTLRTAIRPLLVRITREGNYLQIADAARILRALPHPSNLPLLLQILGRKEFVGQPTPYLATMAIRELGLAARTTAVARLVEMFETEFKDQHYHSIGGPAPGALLALAWLGGEREFQRTEPISGDSLRALWGAGQKTDEAGAGNPSTEP
jgi:hypothetical protein